MQITKEKEKRALIAMSGGVDSSMAAKMTLEQGFECVGCTMKLFENEDAGIDPQRSCCSLDDAEDARNVATKLGMPYYVFNYTEVFRRCVMDKFAESYASGKTPNPCIDCNNFLKFRKLLRRAEELECKYVVTGHYARIEFDEQTGKYTLKKGADQSKDQSYVLYQMDQEQLSRTLMPLGGLTKKEVRALAEENGFVNAEKPDSEDICFVPDGDYAAMIERHLGRIFPEGDFVDPEGNVIGTHRGIIHYTVGQRKHLGQTFGEPRYVCGIDPENNRVILGRNEDTFSDTVSVTDVNWISGEVPQEPVRCKVKTRYKQREQWATVTPAGADGTEADIVFDKPLRAITPGQAAVFYDGDTVLGGGTIIKE